MAVFFGRTKGADQRRFFAAFAGRFGMRSTSASAPCSCYHCCCSSSPSCRLVGGGGRRRRGAGPRNTSVTGTRTSAAAREGRGLCGVAAAVTAASANTAGAAVLRGAFHHTAPTPTSSLVFILILILVLIFVLEEFEFIQHGVFVGGCRRR